MRRLRYEQEQQAVLMLNAYIQAMNGGKASESRTATQQSREHTPSQGHKVSGGDLLAMMGQRDIKGM